MIDPDDKKLSISRQCNMLGVNRSTFYYHPQPVKPQILKLMRLIDEQYMKSPISGSRTMRNYLRRLGYKINRKKVQRLMRLMGLEAIYPKPKTSRPHPQHKVYPYLLRDMTIDRPNQVWAADITYVPMRQRSMYLVAVMDWHSRKVLSFRLSNTPSMPTFALRPCPRRLSVMGRRKSLTPIKALSLPARILPIRLNPLA